jgi:hypothetical protein
MSYTGFETLAGFGEIRPQTKDFGELLDRFIETAETGPGTT